MRRLTPMKVSSGLWKIYRRLHKIVWGCWRAFSTAPAAEILVERLHAVDVGNVEHHDFGPHVDPFDSLEIY